MSRHIYGLAEIYYLLIMSQCQYLKSISTFRIELSYGMPYENTSEICVWALEEKFELLNGVTLTVCNDIPLVDYNYR